MRLFPALRSDPATAGQREDDRAVLRKAWGLLTRRERGRALIVLAVFVLASLSAAVGVAAIYPFLSVVSAETPVRDNGMMAWLRGAFGDPDQRTFALYLGIVAAILIAVSALLQILRTYMVERFAQMRIHSISHQLLTAFTAQPMTFFLGRNTADMAKSILTESREVVNQFFRPAAEICGAVLTIGSILVVLLALAPGLTLAALGVLPLSYLAIYLLTSNLMRRMGHRRVVANSDRHRTSSEALVGIKDIKISGTEGFFLRRYWKASALTSQVQARAAVISAAPRFAVEAIVFCGIIFLCLSIANDTDAGGKGGLASFLPELGLLAIGAQRLMPELQRIYRAFSTMRFGTAALHNVHADLTLARAETHAGPDGPTIRFEREVALTSVSFSYAGRDHPALADIDLTIAKSERIGIVGPTGSGKSTLVDILLGLIRPDTGQIRIDGEALESGQVRLWRRNIGYVPQDIFLIDGTIAENIAFGEETGAIDLDRVEHSAQIAQLHAFIVDDLPQGYDTLVGERGLRLSGGQRQRIGIARALYRDADLIVFDEATSALDSVTERELMDAIDALPGDKTVVLVAHRLATVRGCDRIVVMKEGRITASGSWEDNLAKDADFRSLVAHQGAESPGTPAARAAD